MSKASSLSSKNELLTVGVDCEKTGPARSRYKRGLVNLRRRAKLLPMGEWARLFLIGILATQISGCTALRKALNPYGPPPPPPKTVRELLEDGKGTMKKDAIVMLVGFPDKCETVSDFEICQWDIDKKAISKGSGSAYADNFFGGVLATSSGNAEARIVYTAFIMRFKNNVMIDLNVARK